MLPVEKPAEVLEAEAFGCTITIDVTDEVDQPDDHFDAKTAEGLAALAWMNEQRRAGNEWAWCIVTVSVRHVESGIVKSEDLGGCCYANQKGFEEGGYYEDMVRTMFAEVKEAVLLWRALMGLSDGLLNERIRQYFEQRGEVFVKNRTRAAKIALLVSHNLTIGDPQHLPIGDL